MMLLKWTAGAAAMTFVMAGPVSAGPVLTGVAQVPAPKWGLAAPAQREQAVPAQYKPPAKIAQDKAKARRKQMEKLRKQMQAQKKKTASLSKNMLTLRGALRKARVKLAETGLGPDDLRVGIGQIGHDEFAGKLPVDDLQRLETLQIRPEDALGLGRGNGRVHRPGLGAFPIPVGPARLVEFLRGLLRPALPHRGPVVHVRVARPVAPGQAVKRQGLARGIVLR